MSVRAFIAGLAGPRLDPAERAFFRDSQPWGFILFARNIETPDQVRALVAELRAAVGRTDAPVLIDQEGGRVARLRPPHWPDYPPAETFGRLHAVDPARGIEAARLGARLIAADLADLGITVDCVPCVDLKLPETHAIIGNRAYSADPATVAVLARAAAEGLMAGGVAPIVKHIPGHGRATADSHLELPVVTTPRAELERTDFEAFRRLIRFPADQAGEPYSGRWKSCSPSRISDEVVSGTPKGSSGNQITNLPMAMTAHVVYADIDAGAPATTSARLVGEVIRGFIGFDGLLMTDDLSMKALKGSFRDRALASLDAGCDMLLHCNGDMAEMAEVATVAPVLAGKAAERAAAALACARGVEPLDTAEARAAFSAIVAA